MLSGEDAQTLEMLQARRGRHDLGNGQRVAARNGAVRIRVSRRRRCARAEEIDARLQPIHQILFVETSPQPAKWALHLMGKIDTGIRLPLLPMSQAQSSRNSNAGCARSERSRDSTCVAVRADRSVRTLLVGCGWMSDDKGFFVDRSNDYLKAKEGPPLVVPKICRARDPEHDADSADLVERSVTSNSKAARRGPKRSTRAKKPRA